jgi:hypothetical protein
MSLRRNDHSSRGVLPTVTRRVCDLENLVNEEAIARVGLQRHMKEKDPVPLVRRSVTAVSLCRLLLDPSS